jgi:hypothetical protein
MRRHIKSIAKPAAALMLAASLFTPALAMEATQKVEREVVETQADGTVVTRLEKADLIKPGENIVYTLDFVNTKSEPADGLVLAMPVPAEIQFAEGSAERSGTRVEYSTDGGESFSDRLGLTVIGEDGQSRPATADDITAVRWTFNAAIMPGESGAVSFKGRLR